jgi:aerobic carbon-monoxide dehydrogenase small subunit
MAKKMAITLTLNGVETDILAEPRQTLLEVLRDDLSLMGTKEGCGNGNCGACTVMVNGRPVNSCLVLAVEAMDAEVMTVEGLADPGKLHPIQHAFIEQGGFQCGFCTPGFLLNAQHLLAEKPDPTEAEIRHRLSGNLCRCTGYDKIVKAVQVAAAQIREG